MKLNSLLKFAVNKILKVKMEQETEDQVYDLWGEELLKPQAKLLALFEEIWERQYQKVLALIEQMPEFKIEKAERYELEQEEFSKFKAAAELQIGKAFKTWMVQQQAVGWAFWISFSVNNQAAKDWAAQHAGELITGVNETTKKEISALLNKAINNGLSKKELADQLQTSFAFSRYRANMIANNEIGTAYIQGTIAQHIDLMQRTWIEWYKYWQTQNDDKVSDICRDNQNQGWIPFTQDFFSGHSAPLGHVNCRCVLRVRPFPPNREPDGLDDFGKERAFDELPEHYEELSNKVLPPDFWKASPELPSYRLTDGIGSSYNPAKNRLSLVGEKWSLNQKVDELHEAGHWLHYKAIMKSPELQKKREEVYATLQQEIDENLATFQKWSYSAKSMLEIYKGKVKAEAYYAVYNQTISIAGEMIDEIGYSERYFLDYIAVLDIIDWVKKGGMGFETHNPEYLEKYGEHEVVANSNLVFHTRNKVMAEYLPKSYKAIQNFYSNLYQWLK